eukprot:scaffold103_cov116-Cylindrotheca_fusiformis.AAC.2
MDVTSSSTTTTDTNAVTNSPFICDECQSFYLKTNEEESKKQKEPSESSCCSICYNLWRPKYSALRDSLIRACKVYGGIKNNLFSDSIGSITVSIAGELYLAWTRHHPQEYGKEQFSLYLQDLKHFLAQQIQEVLQESSSEPKIVSNEEEQGYLAVHLLCIPSKEDTTHYPHPMSKKRKRQRNRPFVTQGGDPKINLETKLRQEGYEWSSMTSATSTIVADLFQRGEMATSSSQRPMEFHFSVHRKPIYLQGYYTKHRRDVSQSPFVVMKHSDSKEDTTKTRETLGVTSVEEEICNPIVELLGVSTQNNIPGSSVKYGMCKFHASGREDMDVRMLLRPNTIGRPFCVQLIDALRPLESQEQLNDLVATINHTKHTTTSEEDDNNFSCQWHGKNPMGVGIAPNKFQMTPASAYSGLQADTESKVKHYGCHCWSERPLPQGSDITSQLFPNISLPLEIQQKTPLRVVHRRANLVRERRILQLQATRVDDHHFRLEMSTQAGTYVKEFVHGDLLRTKPSIASLMGCKTNLLLLDCEGIELGERGDDTPPVETI